MSVGEAIFPINVERCSAKRGLQAYGITTVVNGTASRTKTVVNSLGNTPATAILQNRAVITTIADGKSVNINRDRNGGGWFDQIETRIQNADLSRSNTVSNFAKDGTTLLSQSTETVDITGIVCTEFIDAVGSGGTGVHNRYSYAAEMRSAVEAYETRVDALFYHPFNSVLTA